MYDFTILYLLIEEHKFQTKDCFPLEGRRKQTNKTTHNNKQTFTVKIKGKKVKVNWKKKSYRNLRIQNILSNT